MVQNDFESKVGNHPLGDGYHFKLGTRTIRKIEKEVDKPFMEVISLLEAGSISAIHALIKHGTQPEISEDQTDQALDKHGIQVFMEPLTDAIQKSGVFQDAIEVNGDIANTEKTLPAG